MSWAKGESVLVYWSRKAPQTSIGGCHRSVAPTQHAIVLVENGRGTVVIVIWNGPFGSLPRDPVIRWLESDNGCSGLAHQYFNRQPVVGGLVGSILVERHVQIVCNQRFHQVRKKSNDDMVR